MRVEIQILYLLRDQRYYPDYRVWEERLFNACRSLVLNCDRWDDLIVLSRDYPVDVQARAEYLVRVLSSIMLGERFDEDQMRFVNNEPLGAAFFERDKSFPGYEPDHFAVKCGLRRGMMISRLYQFLVYGQN